MRLFKPQKQNIDKVFQRYGDMLYRIALTRLSNDADAQDVVQDVFVKYLGNPPSFKDDEHEKAWFLRTAINCCHDFARRQKTREHMPIDEAYGIAAENDDGVRDLMALLSQLPPIYKDVVILHALEGFGVDETARLLGISLSCAKMRLSRAREILNILRKEEDNVY